MDELKHHGILGQKWGVRRYQNEDGTLTAAGKARYGKMSDDELQKNLNKQVQKKELRYMADLIDGYTVCISEIIHVKLLKNIAMHVKRMIIRTL